MKPDAPSSLAPPVPSATLRPAWWHAVVLAALLLLSFATQRPKHYGDVIEYMLTTVALSNHASPDIRAGDVAEARALEPGFAPMFDAVSDAMRKRADDPVQGMLRTSHGYYAIHFFAYPALAALPFKLFKAIGIDAFRCFQVVNGAALFVLGVALMRLFRHAGHAAVLLMCYLLCGGMLYWQWSSPETFSATGLLAALLLYTTGAPVAGGLLAGLAAMQNPPIVSFCLFAPLLRACLGTSAESDARLLPNLREYCGLAPCGTLAIMPAVFDLAVFGTPSIIGKLATDPRMINGQRLFSFFFDLNQGLLLGVPALAAALVLWPSRVAAAWRVTLAAVLFSVALAVPSLVASNWNSGADGIMRYALWASMPLLFAFAWRLRLAQRWPAALVALVLVAQIPAMLHARRYHYLYFSPLAEMTLKIAPQWYNPEPEIFGERVLHHDAFNGIDKVVAWPAAGKPVKIMYNIQNADAPNRLCAGGGTLVQTPNTVDAGFGWRYINGEPTCMPVLRPGQPGIKLVSGWSAVEQGGGEWDGVWSDGAAARMSLPITPDHWPSRIVLGGHYFEGGHRTRVAVNGIDLGWRALDQATPLPVPPRTQGDGAIDVELRFDATHAPQPRDADQRHLGFFLQKVTLQ